jgi:LCP family protein required for cell wall assembly
MIRMNIQKTKYLVFFYNSLWVFIQYLYTEKHKNYLYKKFPMQKRKVWEFKWNNVQKKQLQDNSSRIYKFVLILVSFILILFLIQPFAEWMKSFFKNTAKWTVRVLGKTVWTPMIKDEYWNINVLLVWYGWDGHWGGYLADSTIVASRDPEIWALSMLSIPRDLFVNNPLWGTSRINSVFTQYYWRTRDLQEAASWYIKEIEKIVGLSIPYFATIDFSWFKKIVDDLWGIDIDVPYALHDYQYPDSNLKWYEPLHVEEWYQHMDWALALKYARSRHAEWHASDFDRSFRQQLVINAIKEKMLTGWNLSLSKAKDLYESYIQMVNTNISLNEMLWWIQYLEDTKMYTFGLNTSYSYDNFNRSQKWSFLYTPQRELFWWASVLLPMGASAWALNHYDTIHQYTDFLSHNQRFSLENATIGVDNWITKEMLQEYWLQNVKIAWRLANKMKRFWLNIVESSNEEPHDFSTIVVNTESEKEEWFEWTIQAIKNFVPIDVVKYNTWTIKVIVDDYWNSVEVFTGVDVQVILWKSYLDLLSTEKFKQDELNVTYRD